MKEKLNIAVIYGSAREGRFCDTVVNWALSRLQTDPDLCIDTVDPARLNLPARHVGDSHPGIDELCTAIGEADGFIVVTPEYNHSFTGELKLLIDAVRTPWKNKPLAFISYGGISGGLRAVEHLRLVFAEQHVATLRETVSFHNVWDKFGTDGEPVDPVNADAALLRLTADLKWWGCALREARYPHVTSRPLEAAAS
ncbi:NADPH-dependent FMN reductase [Thalassospira sp.]|uniref:NADPH-dependent FMN reductase n=1 Tax=Thalassospira sp. TaxID=1912094 RepID=UPI00273452D3|nr:NAD(P)H-dependent oxidoreductase [Thalassospira sp.]MDP2696486.1 NAD(P)H-dependent oxidoreductase [Thalassospira sp.]